MDLEHHANLLGNLVANLRSLEFAIRAYLYAREDPPHAPLVPGKVLDSAKVDDVMPVNAFTDYSSLSQLIDRFNQLVGKTHPELRLDPSVLALHDALAHGRVSTSDPARDLVLLKFDRPSRGLAHVAYAQPLTADWLKTQIRRVFDEVAKIGKAPGSPIVG